jgi:hypothetical protein
MNGDEPSLFRFVHLNRKFFYVKLVKAAFVSAVKAKMSAAAKSDHANVS